MSKREKVAYLTGRVYETSKNDAKYLFCFAAVMITSLVQVLYSIYLMLWITNFVNLGVLASD